MTNRNEALIIIESDILLADDRKDCIDAVIKRVNQFYDNVESRTCENCKHYIFHSKKIGNSNRNQDYYTCENEDVPDADGGWLEPPEDFGCNKFERKD